MDCERELPKISIIIPAYNASQYIEATLRSLLAQTYRHFEITVVDDGSTDDTVDIVRHLAAEDPRILLLQVANGGPANARNIALDNLDGSSDYILFCDADDLVREDLLEKAAEEAKSGADIVIMGFSIVNADGSEHDYFEPDMRLNPENLGSVLGRLYKANLLNQVWGKLFRADLIFDKTIRFPDYRWGEDRFFVFDFLTWSHSISVLSYCGYRYLMHPGQSLITGFHENKAEVCILIDERMEDLCRKFDVTEDGAFRYMFAKSIFSCFVTLFSPSCHLTHAQKRNYVWGIISNRRVLNRCKGARGGLPIRVICWIMSTGSISLNLFAAWISSLTGKLFPDLFRRIKHKK